MPDYPDLFQSSQAARWPGLSFLLTLALVIVEAVGCTAYPPELRPCNLSEAYAKGD